MPSWAHSHNETLTLNRVSVFLFFARFLPGNSKKFTMSTACYVLFSKTLNKFYIGATNDSVEKRLEKHNAHCYGNHRYTAAANDWEVFFALEANDYPHAIRMERKIKSMKSRAFIMNLRQYSDLRSKLINETSTLLFR